METGESDEAAAGHYSRPLHPAADAAAVHHRSDDRAQHDAPVAMNQPVELWQVIVLLLSYDIGKGLYSVFRKWALNE